MADMFQGSDAELDAILANLGLVGFTNAPATGIPVAEWSAFQTIQE